MKNVLINRNLLLIFALFLIVSCSKKSDEVTPALLTGKWKQNGVTGKITLVDNGKTVTNDINEPADNSIIEFKSDGTALYDGDIVKYTLSGSNLTLGDPATGSVTFIAKVSGTNLTLSFSKDEYFKLVALVLDPNDPDVKMFLDAKNKITAFEYNQNYIKQ
jgi:hypothetical protein